MRNSCSNNAVMSFLKKRMAVDKANEEKNWSVVNNTKNTRDVFNQRPFIQYSSSKYQIKPIVNDDKLYKYKCGREEKMITGQSTSRLEKDGKTAGSVSTSFNHHIVRDKSLITIHETATKITRLYSNHKNYK